MSRRFPLAPISFLFAGLLIWGVGYAATNTFFWHPMPNVPLDLHVGVVRLPAFKVDHERSYDFSIEIDRQVPPIHEECLLGGPGLGNCKSIPSAIDVSWILYGNRKPVEQGTSTASGGGAYSQATISKSLLRTSTLEPDIDYMLELHFLKDATVLAPTHPRIVTSVNRDKYSHYYMFLSFWGSTVGAAASAIGIVWLVCWYIVSGLHAFWQRRYKKS